MIDFEILDNFETNNILYFDANGLEMQTKYLYKRKEFTLKTDNIISSNFYPVTSAIAVKDFSGFSNKQVTVMTDRSQAGSAGLRDLRNIELMVQRRHKTHDDDGLGDTPLDEKDLKFGDKGQKIQSNYYLRISEQGNSKQREM